MKYFYKCQLFIKYKHQYECMCVSSLCFKKNNAYSRFENKRLSYELLQMKMKGILLLTHTDNNEVPVFIINKCTQN